MDSETRVANKVHEELRDGDQSVIHVYILYYITIE